jgi:lambda repressor-like predicted transcriptional regulator
MKTFREALISALERENKSLKSVCESAGVSYEQMKKVIQRESAKTNVDDAIKVAKALGYTINEFLADDLASDRIEIARIYSSLSPEEIRLIREIAKGRS